MSKSDQLSGTILGRPRAEADSFMLDQAFVETTDYKALRDTKDFNYVVGRRGTGKSALFLELSKYFYKDKRTLLVSDAQEEHTALHMQAQLQKLSNDYKEIRPITKILWKTCILMSVLENLLKNYKLSQKVDLGFLNAYKEEHIATICDKRAHKIVNILRPIISNNISCKEAPGALMAHYDVNRLQTEIRNVLAEAKKIAVILYDGLDEGWYPDEVPIACLGGLAVAVTDLVDSETGIYSILFVRDNMFRALPYFESDFSRNIEGSTLRLRWDEPSLLQLVTVRLRQVYSLQSIESDVKVWNRCAQRDLQNRQGFKLCLRNTLYRPRDILVLLNNSFVIAARQGRTAIIEDDVEAAARSISQTRYQDLIKEYEVVLPGLRMFTSLFQERPAIYFFSQLEDILEDASATVKFDEEGSSDFALFESGRQIFFALYGVGFLGLDDPATGGFNFCHDGSPPEVDVSGDNRKVMVHPCYWKCLNISSEEELGEIVSQINDEYESRGETEHIEEYRVKQIGQIVSELPKLPIGKDGATDFENWVLRAVKILFAEKLRNFELKPNKDAVQRRDIVATNIDKDGFWRRIFEDYKSRQVIIEVKNYEELKPDDFRQALSYATGSYGKFIMIVTRSLSEGLSSVEKGWIKDIYDSHQCLIFTCTAQILSQCLQKMRTIRKHDYTEDRLGKRMDTFVRQYLSLKHIQKYRKKKK